MPALESSHLLKRVLPQTDCSELAAELAAGARPDMRDHPGPLSLDSIDHSDYAHNRISKQSKLAPLAPRSTQGPEQPRNPSMSPPESSNPLFDSPRPRGRLPPRSRSGCWTCRTRKVKCDEKHPRCGQCVRLSHCCDYSPRISFRDDTQRIVGRMQGVSTRGSIVWDPQTNCEQTRDMFHIPSIDFDSLPPFAHLTNDEERELKAIGKKPGTYNLVCNPDSFANPRTEAEDEDELGGNYVVSSITSPQPVIKSEDCSSDSEFAWNSIFNLSPECEDPEVVILKRFEEPCASRRASLSLAAACHGKVKLPRLHNPDFSDEGPPSMIPSPCLMDPHELVARDLEYHRKFIAPKITKMHDAGLFPKTSIPVGALDLDPFERESIQFPPLFHAIVALSALSSSHRDGYCAIDALQHYQQALPTLQTNLKDALELSSDGVLFTHFLLLIYEILAVEQWRECMWQQHLNQLHRILITRVEMHGSENLPYFVWSLVVIDTYAALTSGGNGELSSALSESGLIPTPQHITELLAPVEAPESLILFQEVLGLEQNVVKLAGKLGQLSHKLRDPAAVTEIDMAIHGGESECYRIVYQLKNVWQAKQPRVENLITAATITGFSISETPRSAILPRIQETYEHACALYNATVIFGYTSVFPLQRASLTADKMGEVKASIARIITQASSLCTNSPSHALEQNHRYMLFPLFLAGAESTSFTEKLWIEDRLLEFEKSSVGANTKVINSVLREIYAAQRQGCDVDWIDFMNERGWRVVIFHV